MSFRLITAAAALLAAAVGPQAVRGAVHVPEKVFVGEHVFKGYTSSLNMDFTAMTNQECFFASMEECVAKCVDHPLCDLAISFAYQEDHPWCGDCVLDSLETPCEIPDGAVPLEELDSEQEFFTAYLFKTCPGFEMINGEYGGMYAAHGYYGTD